MMTLSHKIKPFIPRAIMHKLASLKRKGNQDYFWGKFFGRNLLVFEADQLSRSWYGKEWRTDNRSEFSALSRAALPRDALIFDIGAHQGIVSILLKELIAPEGQVIALEMDAKNVRAAELNLKKNNISGVHVHHQAISDRKSSIRYTGRSNSSIANQSIMNIILPKVEAISIDELCNSHGTPDLIYLDVEGAEILAMKGAKDALRLGPVWFIELHGDEACSQFGGRNEDVIAALHGYGYRVLFAPSEAEDFTELKECHDHSARGFILAIPIAKC